jgi:hypothetical protein
MGMAINPCCRGLKKFLEPKQYKLDKALIFGSIVFAILGGLASAGVLNGMGATNAFYFSLGMYGGAALCALLEVVKIALRTCKKRIDLDAVKSVTIFSDCNKQYPCKHTCKIVLKNGEEFLREIDGSQAQALLQKFRTRCFYTKGNEAKDHFEKHKQGFCPQKVINNLIYNRDEPEYDSDDDYDPSDKHNLVQFTIGNRDVVSVRNDDNLGFIP